jgi:MFS family permease
MIFSQRTAPGIITDTLMKQFQIPASTMGILAGVQYLAYMSLQIPLGIWADKYGPYRFLLVGTLLDGVGTILYSVAPNAEFLMVSRLVVGIGDAMIWINIVLILGEWFRADEFASLLGWTGMSGSLGTIVTTIPLTYWIAAQGWRVPFFTLGLILLICVGLLYFVLFKNKRSKHKKGHDSIHSASSVETAKRPQSVVPVLKHVVQARQSWATFLCHFGLVGTYLGVIGSWGIPYLMQVYHLSRAQAGELITLGIVGAMIGGPLTGFVSDKVHSRKRPYVWIQLMTFICWCLLIVMGGKPPLIVFIILFVLIGYGNGGSMLTFAVVRESFDKFEIGLASGFANTGGFLSAVILPGLFGYVLDLFNSPASVATAYKFGFIVPASFSLIGLIGSIIIYEQRKLSKKTKLGIPQSLPLNS